MTTNTAPELLTVADACDRYDISRVAAQEAIRRRQLPTRYDGHRGGVLVAEDQFEAWAARQPGQTKERILGCRIDAVLDDQKRHLQTISATAAVELSALEHANACRAAFIALRPGQSQRTSRLESWNTRIRTALHEAGHAITAAALGYSNIHAAIDRGTDGGGLASCDPPPHRSPDELRYAHLLVVLAGDLAVSIELSAPAPRPSLADTRDLATTILRTGERHERIDYITPDGRPDTDERVTARLAAEAAEAAGVDPDDTPTWCERLLHEALDDTSTLLRTRWAAVLAATQQLDQHGQLSL
jgi:hypothetical protein